MLTIGSADEKDVGVQQMKDSNRRLERTWSGVGWGFFLILIGVLLLADNQRWLHEGSGWSYFAIGLGAILVIGFFVRHFGSLTGRWSGIGGLAAGLALIAVGVAFLYGLGDWWPVLLLAIGVGCLVRGFVGNKSASRPV
jgi:hypothetical protein